MDRPEDLEGLIERLRRTPSYTFGTSAVVAELTTLAQQSDAAALAPLIECFDHKDDAVAWGATAVFQAAGSKALTILVAALKRPQPNVRKFAAITLAAIGDVSAARPIASALLADKDFAAKADKPDIHPLARALAALKAPGISERLTEALPNSDPAIRAAIVYVLSQSGDATLAALLVPYLDGVDPAVRAEVAAAIGRARDVSRVDELIAALQRDPPTGGLEALLAQIADLGDLGDPHAVGPLQDLLGKTKDGRVKAAVQEAIKRCSAGL